MLLVALVFTLRLPSLFEPHHYGDEGVFAATAQRLLHGGMLYTESWDDKPPLVFLLYAAVQALAGPSMLALRLVGVAWSAAAALTVLAIGRRTGSERTSWVAAVLYAVLAALPLIEGTLLLTEALMVLPSALGVLLAIQAVEMQDRRRDRFLVGAGASLGVAFLFKQVAAFDAAAVGLWLLCRRERPLRDASLLTAGWLLPVGLTALWLASAGALGEAWHAVFGFYGLYLREGSVAPAGLRVLRTLPAAIALAWLIWRRQRGEVTPSDLVLLWFGFAVLGATLAGRPFGHYLVQLCAPAALLVGELTPRPPSLKGRRRLTQPRLISLPLPFREGGRGVRSLVLLLALIAVLATFRGFWFSHPTLTPAYYGNWLSWVGGAKTQAEHDRFYSWRVPNQRAIASLIERDPAWRVASPEDRTLYVWGEYPWLYVLAGARNPTRYSTSYQTAFLSGAKGEVMEVLEQDPPRFIAQELEEWRRLPGLTELLAARYERIAQVDNTILWRRSE